MISWIKNLFKPLTEEEKSAKSARFMCRHHGWCLGCKVHSGVDWCKGVKDES